MVFPEQYASVECTWLLCHHFGWRNAPNKPPNRWLFWKHYFAIKGLLRTFASSVTRLPSSKFLSLDRIGGPYCCAVLESSAMHWVRSYRAIRYSYWSGHIITYSILFAIHYRSTDILLFATDMQGSSFVNMVGFALHVALHVVLHSLLSLGQ